jgi:hypothetical protein
MNYIDRVAETIRRRVSPDKLPEENTAALFRLYAVLALAKGEDVTLEDVHNAWSAWMIGRDPNHESIRPFKELRPEVQREDEPYVKAIHAAVAKKEFS